MAFMGLLPRGGVRVKPYIGVRVGAGCSTDGVRMYGRGYLETFGGAFGTKTVRITPGPEKPGREVVEVQAIVQAKSVGFAVDAPVYEGDQLTWADPRGGETTVWAKEVHVSDATGLNADMAHIRVVPSSTDPQRARSTGQVGHTVIINGSHVNVALEGSTITQQMPVTAGYQELADAVGRALAIIERSEGVDPDEAGVAREAAVRVLEEAAKSDPDASVIRRLLPTLRGVLTAAASSGAGAAASALVGQLFV